ncbi:MAG: hypothetical protein ACRDIE_06935 [Chloroflexota bacterium]
MTIPKDRDDAVFVSAPVVQHGADPVRRRGPEIIDHQIQIFRCFKEAVTIGFGGNPLREGVGEIAEQPPMPRFGGRQLKGAQTGPKSAFITRLIDGEPALLRPGQIVIPG